MRNEDYRDSQLNKSVYYMNTSETSSLVVLAALAGAGDDPWWSNVQQGLPSSIEERVGASWCCLTLVYIKNAVQNKLLLNTIINFITVGTLPTSCLVFTVTFAVFENFVLVY